MRKTDRNGTVVFRDEYETVIAMIPLADVTVIRACDDVYPDATREIIRFW
jgi:hypothetical protein